MPDPAARAEQTALETARDLVARNREGALLADDRPFPIRFIADPATGDLIAPIPEEALDASALLVFVPEESFDAIQLMVEVEAIDESALTDRWIAYHLEPSHPVWARLRIESGKHENWVFEGDQLSPPNPMAGEESALCRSLNEDKDALRAIVSRIARVEAPEPVCVGVNPLGAYVRARFSVVLLRFDAPADTAEDAAAHIERWRGA